MSQTESIEIITKYFPEISDKQKAQFGSLFELYSHWNSQINVISRKDIDQLYTRHILHSLAIAKVIRFKDNSSILDVGTGGGFPGIPLAILFPEVNFHLIDSIGKKIVVVNNVKDALQLNNVRAEQIRAENVKSKCDFIVSRAVTDFSKFYAWVRQKFNSSNNNDLKNGILYLKGGDLSDELKAFSDRIKIFNISEFFTESFYETKKIVYLSNK